MYNIVTMHQGQLFHWDHCFLWGCTNDEEAHNRRDSHVHREYEIYCTIEGESEYIVDGYKFHAFADSLLLVPSDFFHQYWYYPGKLHRYWSLHFLPELLDDTERELIKRIFSAPQLIPNRFRLNLDLFFQALINSKKLPVNLQGVTIKNLIVSLLVQIYLLSDKIADKPQIIDKRIQKVIAYINTHLEHEITMDQLADVSFVTKNYLSTLFHKVIGVSVKKYITIKRMEFVRQNIISGLNAGESAFKAGFNDYSTFYRAYKSIYNYPPSEFMISNDHIPSDPNKD